MGMEEPIKSITSGKGVPHSEPEAHEDQGEHEESHILNIRQRQAWESYINPKSKTFGNALQSALQAGYTDGYSRQITTKQWWLDKMRRIRLLGKAEGVLEDMLDMPVQVTEWEGYGDDKEEVVVTSPALVKIKQDTGKFIAERLGKDEGYSTRSELTGAGGAPIIVPDEKQRQVNEALKNYLERHD